MLKRLLDLVIAGGTLLAFLPVGLPIAILLRLTGEGEIFYAQERIGKYGNKFGLLKFATMLKNSPNIGTGTVTVKNDPRVLPAGKFLRKTKLNEIPQILNVLKGDMSIVGPRPLTQQTFDFYSPEVQEKIKELQPGLTGIGSIVFRDEESIIAASDLEPLECYEQVISPYKGQLEMWYHQHRSFGVDLKLIFLTAWAILFSGSHLHTKLLSDLPPRPFD
ncbi:MAG: sugar transferase [Planctomycetota bacterium]